MDALVQACSVYLPAEYRVALQDGILLPEYACGAALFADISGFTPLTEALTRALGLRRGAEELPIYLDQVYDGLIREVDRFGGSVIGFAGDAITCWFDDHPVGMAEGQPAGVLRAAACAVALQAAMKAFAAVPVPGQDPVALSVKVAVASGPVRRFIVGDPAIQRVELIAGETVRRMAAAEHQANKGEVIFDEATAAACGDQATIAGWRVDGEQRFAVAAGLGNLQAEAPWSERAAAPLDLNAARTWVLPPVYARIAAGLGDFLTELRPATALFLKFGGIDFENDPAAGQKLDAYLRWAQRVLDKHEAVCTHPTIGDKGSFLCTSFGAPTAHDDDSRRAAAAALELLYAPQELAFISPAQIGIAQGTVRAGSYGGSKRKTYDILGDQVNLAARLMVKAQPGEILVSQRVQQQIERDFALHSLKPIMVKGKSQPVDIARLEGRKAQAAGGVMGLLAQGGTLFGREKEFARLDAALEAALDGTAQIVHITGPTGVGKSRLSAEFVRRAVDRGMHAVAGVCQSTQQDAPFLVWQGVMRSLLGYNHGSSPDDHVPGLTPPPVHLRTAGRAEESEAREIQDASLILETLLSEKNPAWAERTPLLGALMGISLPDNPATAALEPKLRFEATLTLAVDILRSSAVAQPLLVLLDDIHWLDEASGELVLAAVRGVSDLPLILLLAQRPVEHLLPELNELPGYARINLSELLPGDIEQIVAARLDAPASPLVAAVVQSQAQGNPYFAEQMLAVMIETGSLVRANARWDFPEKIINTLRDACCIQKNLDTAAEYSQSEWEIIPGAPIPTAEIGLPDSVQGAMLARIDRLPEPEKLTLRAASVLGRVFTHPALTLAHPASPGAAALKNQLAQCIQAGFLTSEKDDTCAFIHNALQEVLYASLPSAVQQDIHGRAGAALEALSPDDLPALAYHYSRGGTAARPQALHYLDLAAAQAQKNYANATALNYYRQALSIEERWQWRKGQAEVLHLLGVRDEEKAAIEALEKLPAAPAAEVYRLQYKHYEAIDNYSAAISAGERLLALSRAAGDWLGEAESLRQLGLVARKQGDNQAAGTYYRQAMSIFDARSIKDAQEQLPVAARRSHATLLKNLGILYYRLGEYAAARQALDQALRFAQSSSDCYLEADTWLAVGLCYMAQKSYPQAQAGFEKACTLARTMGSRRMEATAYFNLNILAQEMGRHTEQQQYLNSALRLLQATGDRWNEANAWNGLGVLYQMIGQYAQAIEALNKTRQLCLSIGDTGGLVYVLFNLALVQRDLGEIEHSSQLMLEGLKLAEQMGDAYMVAFYQSKLGLWAVINGQVTSALDYAQQSLESRRQMGCAEMTSENFATLAMAHLRSGQNQQALAYARQALAVVADCGGQGPESPAQDDFLAFQVLDALGETAEARTALMEAYQIIQTRAAQIQEAELRASYLGNVPVNRQIMTEAARLGLA